ncbi:MAG TPA: hypothetical protein VF219_09085 [Vicinamibacterales bacterium]
MRTRPTTSTLASAFIHRNPNYIWAEAGQNFGVFNDDTPYHADCSPDSVQTTDQHLSAFLMKRDRKWQSYQEDTDVDLTTNAAAEERVDGSAPQPERRVHAVSDERKIRQRIRRTP